MPIARFQLPDGRVARFEVAEGTTPEQATTMMQAHFSAPKEQPKAIDPTDGMSGFDKFAAGAGKAVSDLGSGIKQLGAAGLNKVGLVSDQTMRGIDQDVTETKARDAALMSTGAGLTGNIAGNIATMLLPAGGVMRGAEALGAARTASTARAFINPATYKAAGAAGAVQGGLQPVAEDDSRMLNTAIGGAAGLGGNALINAIGRVAQPLARSIPSKAVQTLQGAGVPLDAAQQSGSPVLSRIRSSLSDNPFTQRGQAELAGRQGEAFNSAALQTMGESGPAATSEVMRRADDRIGGVFDDVLSRNNIPITDSALTRLAAIQQKANDEGRPAVSNIIDRLLNAIDANGAVPGQVAYNIRKDLVRIGKDPNEGFHARGAGRALMDTIDEALQPADRAAFSEARGQFRNMSLIEGAIDNEGRGSISPSKLANLLGNKSNRSASRYGRGDQELVDLAQSGKQLLSDKLPNSGTTARLAMQLAPALAGGASFANDGDASKALMFAGGTIGAPKLLQAIMNNPAAASYLVNGLQPGVKRSLLEGPRQNDLVSALLRNALTSTATRQGQ